jgi:hypothetical protein
MLTVQTGALNEQICRLRSSEPDNAGWTDTEKPAAAVHQEVTREVQALVEVVFMERRKMAGLGLEAVRLEAVEMAAH